MATLVVTMSLSVERQSRMAGGELGGSRRDEEGLGELGIRREGGELGDSRRLGWIRHKKRGIGEGGDCKGWFKEMESV